MPYCPYIKVEIFDAVFVFGGFDKAFAKMASSSMASGGVLDTKSLTAEQFEGFMQVFDEGVVTWTGIVDIDGAPLPCNPETKSNAFPPMQKVEIVQALFEKMDLIGEKKEASSDTPTVAIAEA